MSEERGRWEHVSGRLRELKQEWRAEEKTSDEGERRSLRLGEAEDGGGRVRVGEDEGEGGVCECVNRRRG